MPKFGREQRLLSQQQFTRVFQQGERIVTPSLTLLYCPNALDNPRVGCAISKKTLPKAVRRNQVKRLIREGFRHNEFEIAVDIVVLSRRGIDKCSKASIQQDLNRAWLRLNTAAAKFFVA